MSSAAPDLVTSAQVLAAWPKFSQAGDAEGAALITAASTAVARYCQRGFKFALFTEELDGQDRPRVWLANLPVIAISSVVYEGNTLDNTTGDQWAMTPAMARRGELVRGQAQGDARFNPWWAWGTGNVVVSYYAGYYPAEADLQTGLPAIPASPILTPSALPSDLQRATILLVRHLAEAMDSIGPIKSKKVGDFEYELDDVLALPPIIQLLLAPYVQAATLVL